MSTFDDIVFQMRGVDTRLSRNMCELADLRKFKDVSMKYTSLQNHIADVMDSEMERTFKERNDDDGMMEQWLKLKECMTDSWKFNEYLYHDVFCIAMSCDPFEGMGQSGQEMLWEDLKGAQGERGVFTLWEHFKNTMEQELLLREQDEPPYAPKSDTE